MEKVRERERERKSEEIMKVSERERAEDKVEKK